MPIESTRFCIPSLIMLPPLLAVINPTRNIPRARKIGPKTRCMYFCRKMETAGIDIAVVVSTVAKTR
jgi:hypothetical protein